MIADVLGLFPQFVHLDVGRCDEHDDVFARARHDDAERVVQVSDGRRLEQRAVVAQDLELPALHPHRDVHLKEQVHECLGLASANLSCILFPLDASLAYEVHLQAPGIPCGVMTFTHKTHGITRCF